MVFEMTTQVRVSNMEEGRQWYEKLLKKKPDFIPHEGFAEWKLLPGCWLQVAEGHVTEGNGPLRLGVTDILAERNRLMKDLDIEEFDIHSRLEVPVKWGTFADPWGNQLGFFEYINKNEEEEQIKSIFGKAGK
ncbi:VOC family protein [Bacillus sp. RAR_GA_16]|uniref:VOC family protein n=1 Tax=Bacillus sp. RAR_GA_16 TaxID=2876774 RepID=UPI001CC919AC|nr:VOC family protein [Bacillus sp. RAR_GA_16]MCA0174116.1 VOC family protein [Bacillus sp. RAR_GA_16]